MRTTAKLSAHTIEQAKRGDLVAFEALYYAYKNTVYALCLRATRDVADAEDLTQEVFLQVYRKVKDLRGEGAFRSWLYRVTMTTVLMHLRKRRIDVTPLQDVENGETAPLVDFLQTGTYSRFEPIGRIALARAIGGLPKCRRAVVVLHDIKGISHREIAASLGVSLNTAKSNLCRAHQQLRGTLLNYVCTTGV